MWLSNENLRVLDQPEDTHTHIPTSLAVEGQPTPTKRGPLFLVILTKQIQRFYVFN